MTTTLTDVAAAIRLRGLEASVRRYLVALDARDLAENSADFADRDAELTRARATLRRLVA
jgi:hypothetical protein